MQIERYTFGARRPEQESFYTVTIACRVTERERNQICRRRRHTLQAAKLPAAITMTSPLNLK